MDSEFNPLNFEGKKIFITGASSGIGRATAIYLSRLGAKIVIHGRNPEKINDTLHQLSGDGHIVLDEDLTTVENMEDIFKKITDDGQKLDGMVHSAGIAPIRPLKSTVKKYLNEVMDINFYVFIELMRQYSKKKYNNGGSVVALSSIASIEGELCQTAYSASKSAINAAVRTLSIELASKNIRVNAVMPGMVRTEMFNKSVDEGSDMEKLGARSLLKVAEPEQIAAPITFLLSDMSSFITGRCLYLDGGRFL